MYLMNLIWASLIPVTCIRGTTEVLQNHYRNQSKTRRTLDTSAMVFNGLIRDLQVVRAELFWTGTTVNQEDNVLS